MGSALGGSASAVAQTVASAQPGAAPASTNSTADIVVTATRRSESIHNVPSSISALSQAALEESGATQASDIIHMVPGLAYTQNSVGQAIFAVRGIQTSAITGNVQAPVAVYFNEVPVLDPFIPWTVPSLALFDVSRVEVLRGPQGTLFGAGALSGAIRIITNKPDASKISVATDDTVSTTKGGGVSYLLNGMVNIPIVRDQLAVRAVGYYDYTAGWIDNPTQGTKNTNHATVRGGRVEAEWAPTAHLDVTASASEEVTRPHDSNYVPYGSHSDIATTRVPIYNDDNTKILNLAIAYAMPWATLTSSTSYIHRDAYSSLDFSGELGGFTGLSTVAPLIDRFTTKNFLQEVRLASSQEHPFKWLIGGFLERYRFGLHETISQAGVAGLGYATDNAEDTRIVTSINDEAGFGEASYDLIPALTLTAGVRYAHYQIGTDRLPGFSGTDLFDGPPSSLSRGSSYNAATPKVSLSYKPNADVMVYALANKGFRTGNSNLLPLVDPFSGLPLPSSYAPDHLWNYEVGTKLALFDRRLRIDFAAYYIDWTSIQLTVSAPVSGFNYIANVGKATSKGVEATIFAKPAQALEVGTSLSYTDAKLTSVAPGVAATVGDQLPGSAPFTAYVYGEYDTPLSDRASLALRADYSWTGHEFTYLDNKNNPAALTYGNYASVGARATLSFDRYQVALFVQNLADSRGRIAARRLYPDVVEVRQTPRTIGLTFRAKL